jgi:pimeloyl-[acyl-carrier protein] methyl ester esterase
MKTLWLHKHNRNRLLVFCNGWGMDGCPFVPLQAQAVDVLMCYDYTDLEADEDLSAVIESYAEASLIGWSMGVWAGQCLFAASACQFQRKIAINGTLCPIHDQFGIPVDIFSSTLENFYEAARLKFYRRMCRERGTLETFLAHQPERGIDNQRLELQRLLQATGCLCAEDSIYTDIVIAKRDFILPTANQQRFWQDQNVHILDGSHFLFYGWESWDDILHDSRIGRKAERVRHSKGSLH